MLEFYIPLLSSLAYSSDVLFAKLALDEIPFNVFIFILVFCYFIYGVYIYIFNKKIINDYLLDKKNIKTIIYAIIAILIGTLLADNLMWYSIKLSSKKNLPIIITLIHSVPILSLIIVYLFYNVVLDYRAVIGIIISVIGSSIAVYYSEKI
jgi:drug/metabolite transporter (DMT)-like permease